MTHEHRMETILVVLCLALLALSLSMTWLAGDAAPRQFFAGLLMGLSMVSGGAGIYIAARRTSAHR